MKLLDVANTTKAVIGGLVLCVVLDGFLFYRYQLEQRGTLTSLASAKVVPGAISSGADGESEQGETQGEETNQRCGASDDEWKDDSDLRQSAPEWSSASAKGLPPQPAREPSAPSDGTGETSPTPPPNTRVPPTANNLPAAKEAAPPVTGDSSAALPATESGPPPLTAEPPPSVTIASPLPTA